MDMSISRTTSMNDDGADDGADEGESDYMNNEEVRGLTNRSEDRSPHNSVQQQEEETYEVGHHKIRHHNHFNYYMTVACHHWVDIIHSKTYAHVSKI